MNSLIIWLITLLAVYGNNSMSVAEWYSSTSNIGLTLIFAIIGTPIYILVLASIFGRPRMSRTTGIFIASLIASIVVFIVGTYILGAVLSLVVP